MDLTTNDVVITATIKFVQSKMERLNDMSKMEKQTPRTWRGRERYRRKQRRDDDDNEDN
jgi:hypothetical protein